MAVPVSDNFNMFKTGSGDKTSIAGGIEEGGGSVTSKNDFNILIPASTEILYDPDFAKVGGIVTNLNQITESVQFRNYPSSSAPTPAPNTPPTYPPTLPPTPQPTPAPVTSLKCLNYQAYDTAGVGGMVRYQPCNNETGEFLHRVIDPNQTLNFCAAEGTVTIETNSYLDVCTRYLIQNKSENNPAPSQISYTDCNSGIAVDDLYIFTNTEEVVCSLTTPVVLAFSDNVIVKQDVIQDCDYDEDTVSSNQEISLAELGDCVNPNPPTNPPTFPPTQPPTNPPTQPPTNPPTPPPIPGVLDTYYCDSGFYEFSTYSSLYGNYSDLILNFYDPQYQNYIEVESFTRPNRVVIEDSDGVVLDTGWLGYANYSGPWGSSLNNTGEYREYFDYNRSTDSNRRLKTEYGNSLTHADLVKINISCGINSDLYRTCVNLGSTPENSCATEPGVCTEWDVESTQGTGTTFTYEKCNGEEDDIYVPVGDSATICTRATQASDIQIFPLLSGNVQNSFNSCTITADTVCLWFDAADWVLATNVFLDSIGRHKPTAQYLQLNGVYRYWDGNQFVGTATTCNSIPPSTNPPTLPPVTPPPTTDPIIYTYEITDCNGSGDYVVTTNATYPGPYNNGDTVKFNLFGKDLCGNITGISSRSPIATISGTVSSCSDSSCWGFDCNEYLIRLVDGNEPVDYDYIDCDGITQSDDIGPIDLYQKSQCVRYIDVEQDDRLLIYYVRRCNSGDSGFPPTTPPTMPPTLAPVTPGGIVTPPPTPGLYGDNLGYSNFNINLACSGRNDFTNFNGWAFRASNTYFDSSMSAFFQINNPTTRNQCGFHYGSLLAYADGCVGTFAPVGVGVTPTTTLVNLQVTGCFYYVFPSVPGQGLIGAGNVSHLSLTQFVGDSHSPDSYHYMAISTNTGTNPGNISFSNKQILGSDGQSGQWSVTLTPLTGTDENGNPVIVESAGYVTMRGIDIKEGVTYYLKTD